MRPRRRRYAVPVAVEAPGRTIAGVGGTVRRLLEAQHSTLTGEVLGEVDGARDLQSQQQQQSSAQEEEGRASNAAELTLPPASLTCLSPLVHVGGKLRQFFSW